MPPAVSYRYVRTSTELVRPLVKQGNMETEHDNLSPPSDKESKSLDGVMVSKRKVLMGYRGTAMINTDRMDIH
jgi:hypothetical protein